MLDWSTLPLTVPEPFFAGLVLALVVVGVFVGACVLEEPPANPVVSVGGAVLWVDVAFFFAFLRRLLTKVC